MSYQFGVFPLSVRRVRVWACGRVRTWARVGTRGVRGARGGASATSVSSSGARESPKGQGKGGSKGQGKGKGGGLPAMLLCCYFWVILTNF